MTSCIRITRILRPEPSGGYTILVNYREVGTVSPQPNGKWTGAMLINGLTCHPSPRRYDTPQEAACAAIARRVRAS